MRCLIVEDDDKIAADLTDALARSGFHVERCADGEAAWFAGGTEHYDIIVLDLGLPRMDGLSILRRWRAEGMGAPVLILTARGSWMERVEGIDAGADDYLPKPFHMEELVARARSLVRRSTGHASPRLTIGALELDTTRQTVAVAGQPVHLTPLEYRLVSYLAHAGARVVTPSELLEHLYGDQDSREANAVEAVIARLRRKLGAGVIATRRGFGYHLEQG
ncbi:response regulator transcription factor [Paracoccus sp. NSM]|uniref:response regulator transcription factor n=1 Tax=Paracoccus sp. NSM TaxID=3457784 RepID=UPI004036BC8C